MENLDHAAFESRVVVVAAGERAFRHFLPLQRVRRRDAERVGHVVVCIVPPAVAAQPLTGDVYPRYMPHAARVRAPGRSKTVRLDHPIDSRPVLSSAYPNLNIFSQRSVPQSQRLAIGAP